MFLWDVFGKGRERRGNNFQETGFLIAVPALALSTSRASDRSGWWGNRDHPLRRVRTPLKAAPGAGRVCSVRMCMSVTGRSRESDRDRQWRARLVGVDQSQ